MYSGFMTKHTFELKYGWCVACGHLHVFGYCHASDIPGSFVDCQCYEKWTKDNFKYVEWVKEQHVISA